METAGLLCFGRATACQLQTCFCLPVDSILKLQCALGYQLEEGYCAHGHAKPRLPTYLSGRSANPATLFLSELGLGDPLNRRECLGPAHIRLDCRRGHCESSI